MNLKNLTKGIFLVIIGLLSQNCNNHPKSTDTIIRNVILTEVNPIDSTSSKFYPGVVEESKNVNAAFMTGGKLKSLYAKEGDRINKGQLLATLDDTDYLIGVSQLKVQYEQMTAEKQRMDEMFARHNISPNDYEKFETGYKQLGLQLEMAQNKLGYTKLYSPTDGFVSFRYMQPGELVDAGTPIYKISDDSNLEVSVDLPLSLYLQRKNIKKAYGMLPSLENRIPLNIDSFTPDADNNQLYKMKLKVPSSFTKNLTPGMNISVILETSNEIEGEYLIPSRSLFIDNGVSYVWVFEEKDSTLMKTQVNVIGSPKGNNNIVSGLHGEEKIVSTGVKQLKEGEKVNVIKNPLNSK